MSKKQIEGNEAEAPETTKTTEDYISELKAVTGIYIKTRSVPEISSSFANALAEAVNDATPESLTIDKDYIKKVLQKTKTPQPKTLAKWFNIKCPSEFGKWHFGTSGSQNYRIRFEY